MAKGTYTYEYSDEHGDYTIRKFEGTNIAYKIYDTYDGEKDTPEKAMKRSIEERKAQGKDVSFLEKRLKDKPEASEKETKEKETSEKEDNGEPKLEYETNFHLEAPVNDFEAAQAYLSDDDMTQYIPDELKDVVKDVKWELDDEESGHISFKTTRELTAEESKKMSDWIDGQNSDGLGEGFEQQDFAISYYDPYSGDGPYTYDEYQREIENRYDNLEPSEYADYLSDDAIEQGIQSWMEVNEVDHIETDEEYERVREEVLDDPESYIDWEDIDTAKNDYMRDNEDLQEDHWFNMSSMRGNKGYGQEQNEFKVSELETTASDAEYQKALDDLREYSGIAADQAKEANAPIEEIRDYTNQLKDEFEREHAAGNRLTTEEFFNGGKTQYKSNELQEGKPYSIDYGNGIEKTAIYVGKDENGNNVFYDGEGVDGNFEFSNKFIDDQRIKISDNKDDDAFMRLNNQLRGTSTNTGSAASDIAREFLNPDNEYTDAWLQQQAQENGIEIADLDREIGRQMREGGMSYGQRKKEIANSANRAQRIIDNDEWYDVTVDQKGTKATLTDERTGKTVELDPYDSDDVIKSKLNELRPARNVQPIPFENTDDGYYFFDDHPDATDEDFRKAKEEYNKRTGYEEELNNWYKREYGKTVDEIEAERQETYNRQADALKEAFPNSSKEELTNKVYDYHKEDLDRTVDNFVKNNPRWEEGIYDEKEAEEMFEKNGARTWDVVYDRQYEKAHNTKESIQDRYGLKDKRNEMTVYDYENGDIDEEELTDLLTRGNENKETIDRVISQNKKTTNETMNDSIRKKATKTKKSTTKVGKEQALEYLRKKPDEIGEIKDGYDYMVAERMAKSLGIGKRKAQNIINTISKEDIKGINSNKTMSDKIREAATKKTRNKGIKTIAKEYYGEGWNKLSESQKQIWIERNESWLKSAVEAANKKKK